MFKLQFWYEAKQSVDPIDTAKMYFPNYWTGWLFCRWYRISIGMRVLFTADPDSFVAGKIYLLTLLQNNVRQIALKETTDTTPLTNETIPVTAGTKNKGKFSWYDGNSWLAGQDNPN